MSGVIDRQIPFAFPHKPALGPADFLPHDGVELALGLLAKGQVWPQQRLVLWGAGGVGKTHLLNIWAIRVGAALIDGCDLRTPFWPQSPIAIDDADQVPSEESLLHVLNAATESRWPVVLTFRHAPARSPIHLADLASRVRAALAVEIGKHDDDALAALLNKLLSERQLEVPNAVQRYVVTRLPRTAAAIREAVVRLDRAAMAAQSGVSRPLAAACLSDLFENEPIEETVP